MLLNKQQFATGVAMSDTLKNTSALEGDKTDLQHLVSGRANILYRLLFVCALALPFGSADASGVLDFQKVADRGPTDDSACIHAGGVPIPVTDNEVKTIVRNAKNVDRRLYYQGYVFVMYFVANHDVKSLVVPSYNLTLCQFEEK